MVETTETPNAYAAAPAKKRMLTLVGIYIAALATRFISTGSFTVLPMAAADIGGMEIYPLASNVMGLLSICAMPVYGYLGSRFPAIKRPLLAGSLALGAMVLLVVAMAPSMLVVIVVNFFYGVVSASIFVVAYSLIRDMYSAKQAGIYLGMIGTMTSIGMLVGPALTGIIIDYLGWRWAFHVGWPMLLVAVGFIMAGVKVDKVGLAAAAAAPAAGSPKTGFDVAGAVALTLFLFGLVMSLSFGRSYLPFGSIANNALIALAVAALIALVLIIRQKGARAFIPATVFADRNTRTLAIMNFLSCCSTMAVSFFMPSYIINVLHGSAFQAGLATAVYALLGVFICPMLGRLIAKHGSARTVCNLGTIVRIGLTVTAVLFLSPQVSIWAIYAFMLLAGFYSAQQNVTFSTAPQIQIPQQIRFQANSVVMTAQNLGSSIGLAVYTTIMASFGIANGMTVALVVATCLAVALLAATQFLTPASKD
jgi:MFS family permease